MNLQPVAVISLVITIVGGLALYQPKQYAWVGDQTGYSPAQPIEFSHKVHAKENAIPCEYCHSSARKGPVAGIPAASTCMNCHSQIAKKSPEVQKIAAALKGAEGTGGRALDGARVRAVQRPPRDGRPIEWERVHDLPDFARFDHSAHVKKGVKCQTCHGPVETMARVQQTSAMSMGWCVQCHRDTAAASEKAKAFDDAHAALARKQSSTGQAVATPSGMAGSQPASGPPSRSDQWRGWVPWAGGGVRPSTECSACHF